MKRGIRISGCVALALSLLTGACFSSAYAEPTPNASIIPRLSDFRPLDVPGGIHSSPAGVPAEYTIGTQLAIWEDTLAFCDVYAGEPVLRVFVQRDGEMLPLDEYQEEAPIHNIVLGEEGLAYLVGTGWDDQEIELVVVPPDGMQARLPLGSLSDARTEDGKVGPLMRLDDGRLLVADGAGLLHILEADGTGMRQISDIPAHDFVYYNQCVYFTNENDRVIYRDVYNKEYDEAMDVSYPRLYRMRLDGTHVERLTDCGVRGLAARGPYIFYQNIDDPFVWPWAVANDWLYGAVYCFNGTTGQRYTLGLDSAVYMPTAYGLAAYVAAISDRWDGESGDPDGMNTNCPVFALALYDWRGKPLYLLDAGSLFGLEMPCFVAEDGIWRYEHNEWTGDYTFFAIPMDGSYSEPG